MINDDKNDIKERVFHYLKYNTRSYFKYDDAGRKQLEKCRVLLITITSLKASINTLKTFENVLFETCCRQSFE
jgi:hypothetical protein